MDDHDWHLFDAEQGYEVATEGDRHLIRRVGSATTLRSLTAEEFEQLRAEGPNPKGLK